MMSSAETENTTREKNITLVTEAIKNVNATVNADTNENPISIPTIPMTELVGKIGTENKLKLYVKYSQDADTGVLSIAEKYYIDTTADGGNTVVKKVE